MVTVATRPSSYSLQDRSARGVTSGSEKGVPAVVATSPSLRRGTISMLTQDSSQDISCSLPLFQVFVDANTLQAPGCSSHSHPPFTFTDHTWTRMPRENTDLATTQSAEPTPKSSPTSPLELRVHTSNPTSTVANPPPLSTSIQSVDMTEPTLGPSSTSSCQDPISSSTSVQVTSTTGSFSSCANGQMDTSVSMPSPSVQGIPTSTTLTPLTYLTPRSGSPELSLPIPPSLSTPKSSIIFTTLFTPPPSSTVSSILSPNTWSHSHSSPHVSFTPLCSLSSSAILLSSSPLTPSTPTSRTSSCSPPSTNTPVLSSESTSYISTRYTTKDGTTTLPDGGSTITSALSSGMLSPNVSGQNNAFARNTGAIIGVAIAATFVLIITLILIFFACHRYQKSRTRDSGGSNEALNVTPAGSSRGPLDGDDVDDGDDYYHRQYGNHITALSAGSSPLHGEMDGVIGESPELGQRRPSFGQAAETLVSGLDENGNISPTLSRFPSATGVPLMALPRRMSGGPETGIWFGGRDFAHGPNSASPASGQSSANASGSALSLNAYRPASLSGGDGVMSSSLGPAPIDVRASSGNGSRPQSSTPPTSYAFRGNGKGKDKDRSESSSFKSFLDRFRGVRTPEPAAVVQDTPLTPGSRESLTSRSPSYITMQSPSSLLNPPSPVLHSSSGHQISGPGSRRSTWDSQQWAGEQWPAVTLPQLPPASVVDDPRTPEGLLHPHLGLRLGLVNQDSASSLGDHVDYSRPIGGHVNNRRSTAFNTPTTTETGH